MKQAQRNHTLIHHFLEQSADVYPNKVALIHEDVRATYSEINTKANHLAHYLLDQGVQSGDRVVLLLENSLEYVVSYYGILKAGAVAVPLSTDTKPDGLKYYLADLEPKVLISSTKFERVLKASNQFKIQNSKLIIKNCSSILKNSALNITEFGEILISPDHSNPNLKIDENGLSAIIYTSGSTGKPKGVMLSHRNIVSNTHSICQYLHLTDKDIQMVVLPFFYVMGKSLLNTHIAVGGTIVINNKFAFPATVINQMVEEHVTGFSGVPSTYAYLLHRSPLAKFRDKLESLRYCSQAGGHMSTKVKKELRKTLPDHTEIVIMYGATEASARLTYLEPEAFHRKMDSIGKPIPGVGMKVMGPHGEEVPVGQTGELVGYGPNIMLGYWRDEEATTKVLDEDGYHTGDLGYQDEDGYFYVNGRSDNLLKVGGHRINPQEIEDALMDTGLVIEATVVGIKDSLLGNRLVALIVPLNGNCQENEILATCSTKLPKYKLPSEIKLLRALPKNSSGKIDRTKCMKLATDPHRPTQT